MMIGEPNGQLFKEYVIEDPVAGKRKTQSKTFITN
jgi:hypothetical protein